MAAQLHRILGHGIVQVVGQAQVDAIWLNAGNPQATSKITLPASMNLTRFPGLMIRPATQKETIVPTDASRLLIPIRVSLWIVSNRSRFSRNPNVPSRIPRSVSQAIPQRQQESPAISRSALRKQVLEATDVPICFGRRNESRIVQDATAKDAPKTTV